MSATVRITLECDRCGHTVECDPFEFDVDDPKQFRPSEWIPSIWYGRSRESTRLCPACQKRACDIKEYHSALVRKLQAECKVRIHALTIARDEALAEVGE